MPNCLNANDYDEESAFLIATDAEGRFLGYACLVCSRPVRS